MVLAAAHPELPTDTLALLPIGERDSWLLTLREQMFGPTLTSLSTCPACDKMLEQTFSVEDIRVPAAGPARTLLSLPVDGGTVQFRLPNSHDLAAIARLDDVGVARTRIVERCLVAPYPDGVHPGRLPERTVSAIAARMAQADPQGDIQLALCCPYCAHEWLESFDIVSFLWSELMAWASRMLDQVHRLASAYGWSEADILAMSPWRREAYLCRLGA